MILYETMPITNLTAPRMKVLKRNLKACPLCRNLNLRSTCECYVCGWHGAFDMQSQQIDRGISDLNERAPELLDVLCSAACPQRKGSKLSSLLRALFVRVDRRV